MNNEVRQTPFAFAPDAAFTTSPCVKGFSGGASFPGGAGSLGISKTDKGCDSRQTAVIFHALGNDTAAAILLCSTDASKRAHLTLDQCLAIVHPAPVIIRETVPTLTPVATPQIIVVPVQTREEDHNKDIIKTDRIRVTLHPVGTCRLVSGRVTNVCYRLLDDAVLGLQQNPNARIVLTGPIESAKMVSYLTKSVSRSRIEVRLSDEQDWTVDVQTEIVGENE